MAYDIYLKPVNQEKPTGFGYKKAVKVDGNTKTAQFFLKCLLTPAGSAPGGVPQGTGLPELIGAGVGDKGYVSTVITVAVSDALRQVQDKQSDYGDAVRLDSASVVKMTYDDSGGVDVTIQLGMSDGSSITIELPEALREVLATAASEERAKKYGSFLSGL